VAIDRTRRISRARRRDWRLAQNARGNSSDHARQWAGGRNLRDANEKFGFNPPPITVILQPGDQHIQIGNKNGR